MSKLEKLRAEVRGLAEQYKANTTQAAFIDLLERGKLTLIDCAGTECIKFAVTIISRAGQDIIFKEDVHGNLSSAESTQEAKPQEVATEISSISAPSSEVPMSQSAVDVWSCSLKEAADSFVSDCVDKIHFKYNAFNGTSEICVCQKGNSSASAAFIKLLNSVPQGINSDNCTGLALSGVDNLTIPTSYVSFNSCVGESSESDGSVYIRDRHSTQ